MGTEPQTDIRGAQPIRRGDGLGQGGIAGEASLGYAKYDSGSEGGRGVKRDIFSFIFQQSFLILWVYD